MNSHFTKGIADGQETQKCSTSVVREKQIKIAVRNYYIPTIGKNVY